MLKFFRFILMAMILVAVGFGSALTAMRVAIHGRETTVPNFVKLSPAEAERMAVGNGLSVEMEGQFYSSEIAESHIVSQMPPPGTRVRRGWRVRLAQSLGPQRVILPDVLGQSPRAAELNIRQRGLELGTVAQVQLADAPTDQIIAQSPPANAVGVQSPRLSVLTAVEPEPQQYIMPSFVGHTLAEASATIERAGFKLRGVHSTASPAPSAIPRDSITTTTVVLRQVPVAGQKISADTPIDLEVSQ